MGGPALLRLSGVSVTFGADREGTRALSGVSLEISPGEIFGIVGESGSGKSTLMMAIMGLLGPGAHLTGTMMFEGRDLRALKASEYRVLRGGRVSMVFQNPMSTFSPVVRIDRQMLDIQHRERTSRSEKLARATAMLTKVGIPDPATRLHSYPHQLSGGMLQRVSIAMALLSRPALLIADEPTTALDATLEVQILELLRNLRDEIGCSILYVSHSLGTIAHLCDRVAVMYAGSIVEQGETREVLVRPRHPYSRRLLACDPSRIDASASALPTIPGMVPEPSVRPQGCAFHPRCDVAVEACRRLAPELRGRHGHLVACHVAPEAGG